MNPGPPPPCGPCTLFSLDRVSSTGDVCMSLSSSRVLFRGERVSSSWSRPLMESVPPESWRVGVTGEGSGSISPPVDRLCGDGERGEGWCVPLIVPLSRCQQPLDSPEGHPEGPSGRVLSTLSIRRIQPRRIRAIYSDDSAVRDSIPIPRRRAPKGSTRCDLGGEFLGHFISRSRANPRQYRCCLFI